MRREKRKKIAGNDDHPLSFGHKNTFTATHFFLSLPPDLISLSSHTLLSSLPLSQREREKEEEKVREREREKEKSHILLMRRKEN